jgi:putative SOS response-associated peptidase YedK
MFWLAGLWDRWVGPDGSEVETCCVITTQANALVKPLHNRMPVIIPNGLEEIWLEPGDQYHRHALEPMLSPLAEQGWSCIPKSGNTSGAKQLDLL